MVAQRGTIDFAEFKCAISLRADRITLGFGGAYNVASIDLLTDSLLVAGALYAEGYPARKRFSPSIASIPGSGSRDDPSFACYRESGR